MLRQTTPVAMALATTLTLAGCASGGGQAPAADNGPVRIKQVGVLSLLGDDFHMVRLGLTNFGNLAYDTSVPDWQIDQVATTSALKLLSENHRITSKAFDKAALSKAQLRNDDSDQLWQAARSQGLDTLIIVRPAVTESTRNFVAGVGLYERKMFGEGDRCVYTAYIARVYDVATRKELDSNWAGPSPCKVGADGEVPFKTHFNEYTTANTDLMRKLLAERFDETLAYTLGTLKYGAPKRSNAPVANVTMGTTTAAAATTTKDGKKDAPQDEKKDEEQDTLTKSTLWKYLPEFKAQRY
ncbi:hypothetical protein [Rugamonas sp.]|uniref:hypothetical protein n=1 Tax=Rugamonas sp. TaxID=1926287 RepID=UPI0025DEDE34|nr:hypothetical protein [Rugamonas sp.]